MSDSGGNDCDAKRHDSSQFNAYTCDHKWALALYVTALVVLPPAVLYILIMFLTGTKLGRILSKYLVAPICFVIFVIVGAALLAGYIIVVTLISFFVCGWYSPSSWLKFLADAFPPALRSDIRSVGDPVREVWSHIRATLPRFLPWTRLKDKRRRAQRDRIEAVKAEIQRKIDLEANAPPPQAGEDPSNHELTEIALAVPPPTASRPPPARYSISDPRASQDSSATSAHSQGTSSRGIASPPASPSAEDLVEYEAIETRAQQRREQVMELDQFHFARQAEEEARRQQQEEEEARQSEADQPAERIGRESFVSAEAEVLDRETLDEIVSDFLKECESLFGAGGKS